MKRVMIFFIVAVTLLSACATAAQSGAEVEQPVIVYQMEAGRLAEPAEINVYAAGRAVQKDGKAVSMKAAQVDSLLEQIEDLGFFEMDDSYGETLNCTDCFKYSVTVTKDGRTKTVTVTEGLKSEPPAFWDVLRLIQNAAGAQ
jgi:hypothetical protein